MSDNTSYIKVSYQLEVPKTIKLCGERLYFTMAEYPDSNYYEGLVYGQRIRIYIGLDGKVSCDMDSHHWERRLLVDGGHITALWLVVNEVSDYLDRRFNPDSQLMLMSKACGYLRDMIDEIGESKCDSRVLDSYRLLDKLIKDKITEE